MDRVRRCVKVSMNEEGEETKIQTVKNEVKEKKRKFQRYDNLEQKQKHEEKAIN